MQIGCSTRSLRREIPGRLSLVHVPAWAGSQGIFQLEIDEKHLPSRDASYLTELTRACDRAGVNVACLGMQNDFTLPDPERLFQQIEHVRTLLHDVAVPLGAPVVRVFLGMADTSPAGDERALNALRALLPDLEETGIILAVENHAREQTPSDKLAALIAGVPTPLCRACLDLGSLPATRRLLALHDLAPLAVHAHARGFVFDAAGEETTVDYQQSLAELVAQGYDGILSIVYDGAGDAYTGIRALKALIEKHWPMPETEVRREAA